MVGATWGPTRNFKGMVTAVISGNPWDSNHLGRHFRQTKQQALEIMQYRVAALICPCQSKSVVAKLYDRLPAAD